MSPPAPGIAFTSEEAGDMRGDATARARVAGELGISPEWATVRQVHGATVRVAAAAGDLGAGDAVFTTTPGLPVAVFTADCVGIAIEAEGAVAVTHAGWRGAAAGVVEATLDVFSRHGVAPTRATIGPAIGPCCYEVGPEVLAEFPDHLGTTSWGTASVDLPSNVADRLGGLDVVRIGGCTRCGEGYFSHRRDGTAHRQATVAWMA